MTIAEPVLVTGATGTLGREVVARLRADGVEVRSMSRRAGPGLVAADLGTGAGLAQAVADVGTIVHLASAAGGGKRTAQVDVAGTRRLIDAGATAGVRHIAFVSIVGIDRVPLSYYRAKLAAEDLLRHGPLPWSVLRATQFPQLVDTLLTASGKLGVLFLDRTLRVQPVHPRDVAHRLAVLMAAGPSTAIEEFGGPATLTFGEAAQAWQAARGVRRRVLPIRFPGRTAAAVRAGGLTTSASPAGTTTWSDYLAERYPA
jgi:uncharacterized protein YbjT (DUF2867 family)